MTKITLIVTLFLSENSQVQIIEGITHSGTKPNLQAYECIKEWFWAL
jgi:hypothetical protein